MKKILIYISILIGIIAIPNVVYAAGSINVSTTSLNIIKGQTATFTISASNAVGRVDISTSNGGVTKINTYSSWLENNSVTVIVSGVSAGNATITVKVSDAATFDEEELGGSYIINVNVSEPQQNPTPQPQPQRPTVNYSTNNNLKELTIEGFNTEKIDNNNYSLTVDNDITSININATTEDEKAKVDGNGTKELNIGENNIEITITAENGAQNKINIKVIRKDGYYLEDLTKVLKDKKDINIIIKSDSEITKEQIKEIKESKKQVKFNYFDDNKKLIYSWTIDGENIKDTDKFLTSISYISEYVKEISSLSNYADGLHINFKHNGKLPENTKIKLYVGDKYNDGNLLNLYHFDKKENILEFVKDNLKVKDGYIEFDIEHCSEYFVTLSNIVKPTSSNSILTTVFIIISIIEFIAIAVLVYLFIVKPKLKTNNSVPNDNSEINQYKDTNIHNNLASNQTNNDNKTM